MKKPLISKSRGRNQGNQRGVTIMLVALAMVAIIGMAALSIDVITLYVAREEAQHSADTAALAAARIISISGVTGDPGNVQGTLPSPPWTSACSQASQVATAVANQNTVSGTMPSSVAVSFFYNGTAVDCSSAGANSSFTANPQVQVQVVRQGVPNFFSRLWGNAGTTVTATATAEAFNPSSWGSVGSSGTIIPVQPRCVKPLFVPNLDPLNPPGCAPGGSSCQPFVSANDGHIINPGISLNGTNSGVIGERFLMIPDCIHHTNSFCSLRSAPQANFHNGSGTIPPNVYNLEFLPGQTQYISVAVPIGASGGNLFERAVAGCDQTTVYQCGVPSTNASPQNMVDLSEWPADDTQNGLMALIHESNANPSGGQPTGQDFLNPGWSPYGTPSSYPFQIFAGDRNPIGLSSTTPITNSRSVISVPIFDSNNSINSTGTTPVTVVGFLQLFVNGVDQYGNVDATVMNVAGCSNGGGGNVSSSAVLGTSPVPVRLITPP